MSTRRPWRILTPLFSVLLLAAIWSAYWFVAFSYARSIAEAERSHLRQKGLDISCTKESWGGYPFRFEFACASPVVRWRNQAEARSQHLLVVVLAYYPWQAVVLLDGPTTVSAPALPPLTAAHQRAIATLTVGHNNDLNISAELPRLEVADLLSASRVMFHSRPHAGGGSDVAVSVDGLNYQLAGKPELLIDRAELLGLFSNDISLDVEKLEVAKDHVRYWGIGKLGLDAQRQMAGKLSTQTNDLDGLLKILEPYLAISEQDRATLRTVLGLLGNEAKADIIAKDGDLFVGPFKVARLPPLF